MGNSAVAGNAYVNLVSTPYPPPINQDDIEVEAMEEGWDSTGDKPFFIKAKFPSVFPEMYGEVDKAYGLWAKVISHHPSSAFQLQR